MATTGALAQADPYGASATVTRETFEQSRSVSRLGREQADLTAAGDVGDMLERLPGVVVQRTASGSATPILRGLTGYQVLLMLDDMRLNDALTRAGGSAILNLVDPESVQRIEVVRGPASVIYGSDALGGVVHVRTLSSGASADGEPLFAATSFSRAASAERALRAGGALQGAGGGWGLRLSGVRGYAGAVDRGEQLGPQPFTGHQDWALSGKVEAVPAPRHRLSLSHQSGHLFDMPRSDVSKPGDVQRTVSLDRDGSVLTYDARMFDRRLRLHSYLGVSIRREHRQRLRSQGDQRERERVRSHQAGIRASLTPWTWGSLELGLETTLDRVASSGSNTKESGERVQERGRYVDGSSYDMHALYGLLSQRVARRLLLMLGARATLVFAQAPVDPLFEEALGAGAELDRRFLRAVSSLGMRYEPTPALAWVVSALGGFRAPNLEDFQAFGGGARGYTVPNLRLEEERSWTFESGLEFQRGGWDVRAYGFVSLLSGLIVRVPTTLDGMSEVDGEPVIGRRNASRGMLVGGEAALTRSFDFGLFASAAAWLTWGRSERPSDSGTDVTEPASKVPPPIAVLRTGYNHQAVPYFADLSLALQLEQPRLSEGDKADVRLCPKGPEGCDEVPGFADLTLRVGVRIRERVVLTVAAENILDVAYRSFASGSYAPGRNFVAALRTRW
jgi:outer membrane receptor protein involved in Fe transport